jgi:hypothetical protein
VGDLQEHRKRVKAEQEMAERLLREAFDGYRAEELWFNRVIMLAVAEGAMQIEQALQAQGRRHCYAAMAHLRGLRHCEMQGLGR